MPGAVQFDFQVRGRISSYIGLNKGIAVLFRNFYRCDTCGCEWTDLWPAQCDDDCPLCGARHMSPYKSEDVEEGEDE